MPQVYGTNVAIWVECPRCGQPIGVPCSTKERDGTRTRIIAPHATRIAKALDVVAKATKATVSTT